MNLLPKDDRSEQSHDVAKRVRQRLLPIAARFNATIQVSEVPPGPPVLQTLVAEIYGPDAARRMELAQQVKSVFEQTAGVVDVDWYVESPQAKTTLTVDQDRAGPPVCRRRTWPRPYGWPVMGCASGCFTIKRHAKTCLL